MKRKTRITSVLLVTDLDRSLRFYVDELELFVVGGERFWGPGEERVAAMRADYTLLLDALGCGCLDLDLSLPKPYSPAIPTLGPDTESLYLEAQDAAAIFHRLRHRQPLESGAKLGGALVDTRIGAMFWMHDPSGNLLRIAEPRGGTHVSLARMTAVLLVNDLDRAMRFYVDELKLFVVSGETLYGSGDEGLGAMKADGAVCLASTVCECFDLLLCLPTESSPHVPVHGDGTAALFLEVLRAAAIFDRLRSMPSLESGARLTRSDDLIQTPIGDMFWMHDPSGNLLRIADAGFDYAGEG
jgi:catechol 2,3-dioxygenase-like lactoylglutathione lyase family enzyme